MSFIKAGIWPKTNQAVTCKASRVIFISYTICLKSNGPIDMQTSFFSYGCHTILTVWTTLSLTELGRNIAGSVALKYDIKRIDRLLGKRQLHNERLDIYRWHARLLCGANLMPVVLVD